MFAVKKTIIKPCFGVSLEEVFHKLETQPSQQNNPFTRVRRTPQELMSCNPYANELLHQHPEWIQPRFLLHNKSEEAIYLLRQLSLGHPSHETLELFLMALFDSNIENLDTYLTFDFTNLKHKCVKTAIFVSLCEQPRAIAYIEKQLDKVNWEALSRNPQAIELLERFPQKIWFRSLAQNTNPRAIEILRLNPEKIDWQTLCSNPSDAAMDLILENLDKISYTWLNKNPNQIAICLLKEKLDAIDWADLCYNPSPEAVCLLSHYPSHINWKILCAIANTKHQFELIRANLEHVSWENLCQNPSDYAVQLLAEHPQFIHWNLSLRCQNVFETKTAYDYEGIRLARYGLHQDFFAWFCTAIRTKWEDWGFAEPNVEDMLQETTI